MKKVLSKILCILLGIIIGIVAVLGVIKNDPDLAMDVLGLTSETIVEEDEGVTYTLKIISEKVKNIGELATQEYDYVYEDTLEDRDVELFNKSYNFGWFTDKKVTMTYSGIMKLGVAVSDIKVVSVEDNVATITIPHSQVLSHEIVDGSVDVDDDNAWFNKVSNDDREKLRVQMKKSAVKQAKEKNAFTKADENCEKVIKDFLECVCPGLTVNVTFEEDTETTTSK